MFTFISVYSLISSIPRTYTERGYIFTFISVYSLISSIPWTYSDVDRDIGHGSVYKISDKNIHTSGSGYSLVGFCM